MLCFFRGNKQWIGHWKNSIANAESKRKNPESSPSTWIFATESQTGTTFQVTRYSCWFWWYRFCRAIKKVKNVNLPTLIILRAIPPWPAKIGLTIEINKLVVKLENSINYVSDTSSHFWQIRTEFSTLLFRFLMSWGSVFPMWRLR